MNYKVSQLTSLTSLDIQGDDLLLIIDSSSTTVKSKKVTVSDLVDSRVLVANSLYFVPLTQKGIPYGVATLDSNGLIPSSQLPSFVDDVLEFPTLASFPPVGEAGKFYVDLSTNKSYRWTGSTYIEMAGALALTTTGNSGPATLVSSVLNIPNYTLSGLGGVPLTRQITINGTTYDLSTDRTWTISTVSYTSRLQHQVKAGVAINKGQAVYVTSADGTNMIVGLASNSAESTSSKTMGLLDATVSTNGFANVVTEGLLAGLNTTGATSEGDPVWLGTGGNLIYGLANKPVAPAHLVFIGIVTRRNANNGEIFVKVQNGFELDELHNVDARNPSNNDGIFYNSTSQLWEHKQISSIFPTPTLDSVTTAGNNTTNSISVGGLTSTGNINAGSNLIGRSDWGQGIINFGGTGEVRFQNSSGGGFFYTWYQNGNLERMRLSTNNNLLIGTTTDAGYKLDVSGTIRSTNVITAYQFNTSYNGQSYSSQGVNLLDYGDGLRVGYSGSVQKITLFTAGGTPRISVINNGNVGFSQSTPVANIHTSSSITASLALAQGVYFNNTLVAAANNDVLVGLDINPTFTNGAFTGVSNYGLRVNAGQVLFNAYGAYNTITPTLRIENVDTNNVAIQVKGNVANYKYFWIYDSITSEGIYKTDSARIDLYGGTSVGFGFVNNYGRLFTIVGSTGNILINTTTDSGYKLDVNGSARVVSLNGISFLTSNEGTTGNLIAATGRNITFVEQGQINTQNGSAFTFRAYADSTQSLVQNASGRTTNFIWIKSGFSGANYASTTGVILNINPTYNLTGTNSNTLVRGIYYNPVLTDLATATHTAIETTSGNVIFSGGGPRLYLQENVASINTPSTLGIMFGQSTTAGYATGIFSVATQGYNRGYLILAAGANGTNEYNVQPSDSNITVGTGGNTLYKGTNFNNKNLYFTNETSNTGTLSMYWVHAETKVALFSNSLGSYGRADFRIALLNTSDSTTVNTSHTRFMVTGDTYNVLIGTTTDSGAKLSIKGSGSTSATTSLLVQNSGGTVTPLKTFDDGTTGVGWDDTGDFNSYFNSNGNVSIGRYGKGLSYTRSTEGVKINNANFQFIYGSMYWSTSTLVSDGRIGVQGAPPASSALSVTSTTQGFLPPRMTTAQKNAIASPAEGLMVYDTTLKRPCFYDGTTWVTL